MRSSENPFHSGSLLSQVLPGVCIALLAAALTLTGCTTTGGSDYDLSSGTAIPTHVGTAPLPPSNSDLKPDPTTSPGVSRKNISITRPAGIVPFSSPDYRGPGVTTLHNFSDPRIMEKVNGYLRWESIRARTNKTERLLITGIMKEIDTAIDQNNLQNDIILYLPVSSDESRGIRESGKYTEEGYPAATFDPTVAYHTMNGQERDNDGYSTLIVFTEKTGSHCLYFNETRHEILLPRSTTWELEGEEEAERIVLSLDSIPRYREEEMKNIRLLSMNRIT